MSLFRRWFRGRPLPPGPAAPEAEARQAAGVAPQAPSGLPASLLAALTEGTSPEALAAMREVERLVAAGQCPWLREVVEPVAGLLRASDWEVRGAAAGTLARVGCIAVPVLLRALDAEETDCQCDAAWALGAIGAAEAVAPLVGALPHREARVQCFIATALAKIGDARAVPALVPLLDAEDAAVRSTVAAALGRMGALAVDALLAALGAADTEGRPAILWALGELADIRAVDALVEALTDTDVSCRAAAASALGRVAAPARESGREAEVVLALTRALDDDAPDVRQHAAFGLGQTADAQARSRAVDAMVSGLNSASAPERAACALVLGEIGGEPAIGALRRRAALERDRGARGAVQSALAVARQRRV